MKDVVKLKMKNIRPKINLNLILCFQIVDLKLTCRNQMLSPPQMRVIVKVADRLRAACFGRQEGRT